MMIADTPVENILAVMGLGNPGRRYAGNRHNFGFMVVDKIAFLKRKEFSKGEGPYVHRKVRFGRRSVILARSTTYMNNSGQAACGICREFGIVPQSLLVIGDDCNLLLGKIRYRAKGSDGGHNGLASLIEYLQTEGFPRIRLGIGAAPEGVPREEYVLEDFTLEETKTVEKVVKQTVELIETLVNEGSPVSSLTLNVT